MQTVHPKILTGAKLKYIDKRGNFIFSTDDGMWSIQPSMLIGITERDVYATGTLVRVTNNNKDKYKWVEDVVESIEQTKPQPVKKNNSLSRGLTLGKTIAKKLMQ